MSVFVVTSAAWRNGCLGDHYCNDRVAALTRAGAIHVDVQDMEATMIADENDVIITFVNPPASHFMERVHPHNRWLFTVDECVGGSHPYEKQVARCKEHSMGGVIATYGNEQHLQVLRDAGLKVVVFPLVMGRERRRSEKSRGVLASGQLDVNTYPERARVFQALSGEPYTSVLAHPGYWPNLRHDVVGEKYLELLDSYQLVIVDRAGHRDRFVAKYYEAAQCHALPVGDCPSYMPPVLREMMVNTEGMPDEDVRAEVRVLMKHRDVLEERQECFRMLMHCLYHADDHARRVMREVNR